jgi:hypothetical protein
MALSRLAAMTSVAYVLCDVLHELGHMAATLLPLGITALTLSTIGLSTSHSNWIVAAAGPIVNLALSLTILLASARTFSPAWRYFGWLFGSINLFNATAYLI